MASLLFCIVTYVLLSTWLHLVHAINEKVESTLPSSLLIRVLIIIAVISLTIHKKSGLLKYLIVISFGLIFLFIDIIIAFHLFLNTYPDIYDFVFYYESFLLIYFCGLPFCLYIRMV